MSALYAHFPWCVRKCPYCDFNSFAASGPIAEDGYVAALLADLDWQLGAWGTCPTIDTIFLGGGTPSLFSPAAIARFLAGVRTRLQVASDAEITMEANPGTVECGRFQGYRNSGLTRISLGAQSFDAAALTALGRIHSPDDTRRAVEELRSAGFDNFNLDLMSGLPGQDERGALADIEAALALAPTHLSYYPLTLEPGTVFAAKPPATLPMTDAAASAHTAGQARLTQAGFARYEVAAFAKEGFRCRHNLNYWRFGDYLGIGAGAHGKWTMKNPVGLRIERTRALREPRRYLEAVAQGGGAWLTREPVNHDDLPFEYLMNAFRLCEGFEEKAFEGATGLPFAVLASPLAGLVNRQLVQQSGSRWSTTTQGFDFLNEVLLPFLTPTGDTFSGMAGAAGEALYTQRGGVRGPN